jgi:xanthine dehydrogenase YagS FAD-binding subunit
LRQNIGLVPLDAVSPAESPDLPLAIEDYALIGDCTAAALVGPCLAGGFPHFEALHRSKNWYYASPIIEGCRDENNLAFKCCDRRRRGDCGNSHEGYGAGGFTRTRCAYFYDVASACNKRNPGAGCDARGGDNRLHAVLGWSEHCVATHPSDFCVPLVALDAVVEIEGVAGRREIPLETFHRLPGDAPDRESVLEPGEMIVAVHLPAEAAFFAAHARYLKVRERTSYAFAVVSAAAALRIEADLIADARFALGGVALKPWRSREAERILIGAPAEAPVFRRAAEVALAEAKPSGNNAFKIELARRVVVRAFALAAAGTPERLPALPGSPFAAVPGVVAHA